MNYWNLLVDNTTKILFVVIFILSLDPLLGQEDSLKFNSSSIVKDSTKTEQLDTLKFKMKKSAWGAVLRSAILPGFGQFYNESYWKVPVVLGVLGYLGYQWNNNNALYKDYRDLYKTNSITNPNSTLTKNYYENREFYRDQRDLFAVYIGLTYFLNLVDAFVDAHLFDFDVSENVQTKSLQLSMKLNF